MDKFFVGLPLELVFLGNLVVSVVGYVFIFSAPVLKHHRNQKKYYSLFWISLILYYFSEIVIEKLYQYRPLRITSFLDPWSLSPNYRLFLSKSHWTWMFMVVLADLPILILCLSHFHNRTKKIKYANVNQNFVIILCVFIVVWTFDFFVKNNSMSSLVAFMVFFYTACSCRVEHISSSIIWIIYGFLHLPIGLAMGVPIEWRHSIFVTLLASKLSLVVAMYNVLEVKKSKTFA